MSQRGKYRWRTWLRGNLPYFLSDRIEKGSKDCGDHEWYNADGEFEHCYHCSVGVRRMTEDQKRLAQQARREFEEETRASRAKQAARLAAKQRRADFMRGLLHLQFRRP